MEAAGAALGSFQLLQQELVGHDVYVYRVDCNCDATGLAAATSENEVGLLDPGTLRVVRKLEGHNDGIEDVTFFQGSPSCLASCSRDGSARVWDIRAAEASVQRFELKTEEAYSCSVGCGDSVLACGASNKVHLFDLAKGKRRIVYKDIHSDTVNKVRFHPVQSGSLLSGSVDNLVVLLDTSKPREDEAMVGCLSNDECVQSFTLVGPARNTLCCVSSTEQVRIFGLGEEDFGTRRAEFLGIREHPLLAREESLGYVVDTFYDEPSAQVFLLAGSGEDAAGLRDLLLFRVSLAEAEPVAAFVLPRPAAEGAAPSALRGHTGMVRSAVCLPGGAIVTAGEDGLICAWREDSSAAPAQAAPASAAARFSLEPTAYGASRARASDRAAPY